jgi:hypothetical protein
VLISIEGMVYSLPFEDDFESDRGWVVNPDGTDTATSGWWERENPQGTDFDGPKQLDVTTSETHNLVTGHFAGSNASKFDVDGLTTIRSPLIQLPIGQEITLTFHYYLAHGRNASSADFFRVQVMGDTSLTVLEVHALNEDVDAAWTLFKANLDAFAGQAVQIQIEVGDLSKNSLVEAAVDDFSIIATDPSTPLLLADFDTGTDGFAYIDNAFRDTNQSSYADGAYLPNGGVAGGGLQVVLGGLDTIIIREISGGWGNSFSLPNPSDVIVSFWYKLTQSPDYDLGEYSQVLVSIDGVLYGDGANDYVAQIDGNGNGGIPETTDWQFFSIILENLSAGDHQLVIGGYNNQKSYTNEVTEILIDQIRVRLP